VLLLSNSKSATERISATFVRDRKVPQEYIINNVKLQLSIITSEAENQQMEAVQELLRSRSALLSLHFHIRGSTKNN